MVIIPTIGTTFLYNQVPEFIQKLSKDGLIILKTYRRAICSGRASINIGSRLDGCGGTIESSIRKLDDYIVCSHCSNEYTFDEFKASSEILHELTHVYEEEITNKIVELIRESGLNLNIISGYEGIYSMKIDGSEREFLLIFPNSSVNGNAILTALNSMSGVILIAYSNSVTIELPETVILLSGLEIITDGFEKSYFKIRDLPTATELIQRLNEIPKVETEFINKSAKLTWQIVEDEVANFFFSEVRKRVVEKYKYKLLLQSYPQFSRIPVNAAGAGNADKLTINLSEYLDELFDIEFTADVKRYTSTSVDHKTMEKVLHHLSKSPFDAKRVVIIATTNNVTCWDDVASFKVATGQYRLIIFTARLIAEISVNLGFADSLLELMDKHAS